MGRKSKKGKKVSKLRVRLKNVVYETEVISSGFGTGLEGDFKVGKVVDYNNRYVVIRFYDKYSKSFYEEKYNTVTGVRIQDMFTPLGWRVNPKEWKKRTMVPDKIDNKKPTSNLKKVHEEKISLYSDKSEYMVLQVWEDTKTNETFLLPFRVVQKIKVLKKPGGGYDTKTESKQFSAMVPFKTLKNLLKIY